MNEKTAPPLGFSFAACHAGIRKQPGDDLALMVSEREAAAAAVFTRNQVRAAPVEVSRQALEKSGGLARAIICNAGNANCATATMTAVAERTQQAVAQLLQIPPEQTLVSSTGVIGEPLDVSKIEQALPGLHAKLSPDHFDAAANAIRTTDTVHKVVHAELELRGGVVRIAGMAKGSGMIEPNMATMLAYVFTDADVDQKVLPKMLRAAVDQSFNAISVDSDTSTNDTCVLLANGAAGIHPRKDERKRFEKALTKVCEALAIKIVRDGEGASKLLTIYVEGASSNKAAMRLARAIGNSPLVKTALAGEDPNWGRILPAAGKAGVAFDPADVDIFMNGHRVCRLGTKADFDEAEVQLTMSEPESVLRFHIAGRGRGEARFRTCDLTADYVRINADYRT